MSHEVDLEYYRQCAEKERKKAAAVSDAGIRQTHERMAELYERKVAKMFAFRERHPEGGSDSPD